MLTKLHAITFVIALTALAVLTGCQAQTTATVICQDDTTHDANGYFSTNFVGLKLPSGGGDAAITFTPGDMADYTMAISMADESQSPPFYLDNYVLTIGAVGHYWIYYAGWGGTTNYDWMEIRVEASSYQGTVSCYCCHQPYYPSTTEWLNGWPPLHSDTCP